MIAEASNLAKKDSSQAASAQWVAALAIAGRTREAFEIVSAIRWGSFHSASISELARDLSLLGRQEDADELIVLARKLPERIKDPRERIRAVLEVMKVLVEMGRVAEGRVLLNQLLSAVLVSEDPLLYATELAVIARGFAKIGMANKALEAAREYYRVMHPKDPRYSINGNDVLRQMARIEQLHRWKPFTAVVEDLTRAGFASRAIAMTEEFEPPRLQILGRLRIAEALVEMGEKSRLLDVMRRVPEGCCSWNRHVLVSSLVSTLGKSGRFGVALEAIEATLLPGQRTRNLVELGHHALDGGNRKASREIIDRLLVEIRNQPRTYPVGPAGLLYRAGRETEATRLVQTYLSSAASSGNLDARSAAWALAEISRVGAAVRIAISIADLRQRDSALLGIATTLSKQSEFGQAIRVTEHITQLDVAVRGFVTIGEAAYQAEDQEHTRQAFATAFDRLHELGERKAGSAPSHAANARRMLDEAVYRLTGKPPWLAFHCSRNLPRKSPALIGAT